MANYILRKFDDALWQRFKARAQAEGHPLRWVLTRLIWLYADAKIDLASPVEQIVRNGTEQER